MIFQPHGYTPTNFLKEDFISTFAEKLLPADILFMPDIFYAGGTANKTVSSEEIVHDLKERGVNAFFTGKRDDIIKEVRPGVESGHCILVMGARDDSLTDFCHAVLDSL